MKAEVVQLAVKIDKAIEPQLDLENRLRKLADAGGDIPVRLEILVLAERIKEEAGL